MMNIYQNSRLEKEGLKKSPCGNRYESDIFSLNLPGDLLEDTEEDKEISKEKPKFSIKRSIT